MEYFHIIYLYLCISRDLREVEYWIQDGPDEPYDEREYKSRIQSKINRSETKANQVLQYTKYFPNEFDDLLEEIEMYKQQAEDQLYY